VSMKYTASTDMWLSVNNIPTLRAGIYGGGAAARMGGGARIYVVGGAPSTSPTTARTTSEAYTVTTDTWATKTSMPTARKGLAVAATTMSLFALGGDGPGTTLNTLEMLTFATDVWQSRTRALIPGRPDHDLRVLVQA
jgi:hypothetical protein